MFGRGESLDKEIKRLRSELAEIEASDPVLGPLTNAHSRRMYDLICAEQDRKDGIDHALQEEYCGPSQLWPTESWSQETVEALARAAMQMNMHETEGNV